MRRDAHYYAILAFCRACGFTKDSAQVVAYASQFVDDARTNLMFLNQSSPSIEHDIVQNRPAFFNMATCHSYIKIKTFNYEAMVNNTSAFHFVPGYIGENFTKKLRCKEESPVILDILNDVLLEDDLIKLGIALHAYADTFSHQGFSGILSKVNDIKNCRAQGNVDMGILDRILHTFAQVGEGKFLEVFDRIMPGYGHIQAMVFPDIPYLVWSYEYDFSDEFNGSYKRVEIDNKQRYQRAFNCIRSYLEKYLIIHTQYLDKDLKFKDIELLLDTLVSEGNDKRRERNWKELLIQQRLLGKDDLNMMTYEDTKWTKEAFSNFDDYVFDNRTVEGVQLADNFLSSNWYQFYRAVKWYKKQFFAYCNKYQLNIPN